MMTTLTKTFIIFWLISLAFLHFTDAESQHKAAAPEAAMSKGPSKNINCGAECTRRCSKSSRPRLCHRTCGTCCARCNCMPPGTSGNADVCPCYANMRTHGNRKKCP